jgi:sugar lactone lactonase YvrE
MIPTRSPFHLAPSAPRASFRTAGYLLALLVLLAAFAGKVAAQTATVTSGPTGPVAVGSSATYTITFTFNGLTYPEGVDLITNGSLGQHVTVLSFESVTTVLTAFAEYTLQGDDCTNAYGYGYNGAPSSCTATVTFSPKVPGARPGAVVLKGSYDGTGNPDTMPPLTYAFLNGTATGPQAVFSTGTVSNAVTGLSTATAVAVDGAGDIYFTDQTAGTLSELTVGSSTPTVLVSGIHTASGVAVDGVGNIYYGSYTDNKVYRISYNGGTVTPINVNSPDIGMAVDGNGNVYVAGSTEVSEIAANASTAIGLATVIGSVPAVAVDSAGNVFFTDFTLNKIYKVPAGTFVATALTTVDGSGTNELSGPRGIAVDAAGNLYVANQTSQTILRLDNGTWTQKPVMSGSSYSGLAMDLNGSLYLPLGSNIVKNDRTAVALTYAPLVVSTNSAQQSVTLENDGTSSLSISSLTTGTSNANAGGAATTCSTSNALGVSAQCVLGVRFAPTLATTTSGTLAITDNSLNNNTSTQNVQLTGSTANDPQTITFVPASPAAPTRSAVLPGTASSGLTVTYAISSGPATISVSGDVSTITYTGAGTVVITASQAGNTNYAAATPVQATVQVVTAPVITFTPPSTGVVGTPITLSATSTQSATPVIFSVVSGPGSVIGSQLTLTSAGTVVVAANQVGNANYPSAATAQANVQSYATQTITFTPTTPVAPGTSTTLSASASPSGLPVSFAVASGPATIAPGTSNITYNAVGNVVITASQAGNGTYAPATTVQATVAVVNRPVITFLPTTPATLGSTTTLTATSTQNATPITFSIVQGTATLSGSSITYTYAEPVIIQASQAGNASYPAATPVLMTVNVIGAAATTSLAITAGGSPASSAAPGSPVTLTATVSTGSGNPSQGQVTFCDAPTASACTFLHVLGVAQLRSGATAGTAVYTFTPGVGSHNFYAIFGPSSAYAKSASTAVPFTVNGTNTTTLLSQSGSAGNYTLTGTVIGDLGVIPSGALSFLDTSNSFFPLASASLVAGSSTASVRAISHPAMTGAPSGVVTADFNGDGILDLATANSYNNTVSVLEGNGDGSFSLVSTLSSCNYPVAIASADFNGDGIADLAVANDGDSTVTILLGNGDGTFNASSVTVNTVGGPAALAVGDFNGDGIADIAVGGYSGIAILLGNGDGTFTNGTTIALTAIAIETGDFNGDGVTDLAVSNGGSTPILLGQGNGSFVQNTSLSCAGGIAVSDFNGDGIADVAVESPVSVCIFQGNGNGTFTTLPNPSTIPMYGSYYQTQETIAAGDFNGDGIPDVAVETYMYPTGLSMTVLQGKGDGTFSIASTTVLRSYGYDASAGLVTGDFNKDGLSDIFAASFDENDYSTFNDYSTVFLSSVSSTATATVTGINPTGSGTHNVAALYPGQAPYTSSISPTTALTASNLLPNTITFPQPASPVAISATATLAATSTAGNVVYTITAGTASLSGSTITYTTGGTVQITASSPANGTYAAATPVSVTVLVTLPQASVSWLPSTLSVYTGTALSAGVLDATDSVPATINYSAYLLSGSPSSATAVSTGTLLSQGDYGLTASIAPSDNNYAAQTLTIPFTVQNMNVFVAASNAVFSLYNNGNTQSAATSGGGIGAAVDSSGNVWSINADGSGVSKFSNAGALLGHYSIGSGATALTVDGLGHVWITNSNGTVSELNNDGSVAAAGVASAANLSSPASVSVDAAGSLWIANKGNNTVTETFGEAAPASPISAAVYNRTTGTRP